MRVEDCIVAVERRTTGGCLDLAIAFARRFAAPLIRLTLCFAIPSLVTTWMLADSLRADVFVPSVVVFVFFYTLYSGALVAAVGPQVFGVPIRVRGAIKSLFSRVFAYTTIMLLLRTTGFCLFLPLVFVSAWSGHLPEVMFLERTPLKNVSQRLSWLCKGGGYSRNIGRIFSLGAFWLIVAIGLFWAIDLLAATLFNTPVFRGTIAAGPDWGKALAARIIDDPMVNVAIQLSFWIACPIVRLAWFFCYLDQRIRNECWDIELQFRAESARLMEQLG